MKLLNSNFAWCLALAIVFSFWMFYSKIGHPYECGDFTWRHFGFGMVLWLCIFNSLFDFFDFVKSLITSRFKKNDEDQYGHLSDEINEIRKLLCQHADAANVNNEIISRHIKASLEFSAYSLFIVDYSKESPLRYEFPAWKGLSRKVMGRYFPSSTTDKNPT